MKRTMIWMLIVCMLAVALGPVHADERKHQHCVCGGNAAANHKACESAEWTAIYSEEQAIADGILSDNLYWLEGGKYYFAESFQLSKTWVVPREMEVSVCINGQTITGPEKPTRMFLVYGDFDICDCAEKSQWGEMVGVGVRTDTSHIYGAVAYLMNVYTDSKGVDHPISSSLDIYGGRFVNEGIATSGGLFFIGCYSYEGSSSVMNLYDGVLTGGYVDRPSTAVSGAADGGSVGICAGAVLNMYGGVMENGYSTKKGGHVAVYDNSGFNMYGGLIQTGTAELGGGAVRVGKSTINLEGGTIADCSAIGVTNEQTGAKSEGYGGLIYLDAAGVVNLNGTSLRRGNSHSSGGGIYVTNKGTVNMSAGTVADSTSSTAGGNFRVGSTSSLHVTGGTISGGKAATDGGNVYNTGTVTMKNCTVFGGEAANRGGNVCMITKGTATFEGVTLRNGFARSGGNVFLGCSDGSIAGTKATFRDCKVYDGVAYNHGGNVYGYNNSTLVIERTDIYDGVAYYCAGNVFAYHEQDHQGAVGTLTVIDSKLINGCALSTGDCLYTTMPTVFKGVVRVTSESDSRNTGMYIGRNETVDGSGMKPGSLVDVTVADTTKPFSLTEEGAEYFRGYSQRLKVVARDGKLYLEAPMVAVYEGDQEVGQYTYLQYATDFFLEEDQYVKLLADRKEDLTLKDDTYLDLNGYDLSGSVELSGNQLYGMDSTTNLYDGSNAGTLKATVTNKGKAATPAMDTRSEKERTGSVYRYLTIPEENGWSFHRIYLGVDQVTLHTGLAGLSYRSVFAGDEAVKAYLDDAQAYGLALSVTGVPKTLKDFSSFTASSFAAAEGNSRTTVLMNILQKNGEDNETNSEMTVYGRSFLRTKDGHLVMSQPVAMSFRDVVELVDGRYDTLTAEQKGAADRLYQNYKSLMSEWELENIGK